MRLVINFRKQETNIPLTCIFIYTVQTKLVQCTPPPLTGGGGGGEKKRKEEKNTKEITLGKEKKNKGKEMCNLFRACLYFEEVILNQNR